MKTKKNRPIYLDYMATTPVDPRVIKKMLHYLGPEGEFGNTASKTHVYGLEAAKAVAHARTQIADLVGATAEEIIFTSGATEANNLAILGAARFYQRKGRHLVTMTTEHKSVLDSFHQLEKEGFTVTYLNPAPDGIISLNQLAAALREDTILVSIMHVNNEIGVIQDIASIGHLLKGKGILFHVDAAQSAGKLPIDLSSLPVDVMAFSGHKLYAPKGIGALFIRQKPRVRLQPLCFGGGHEGGLRSGTLPTHQIVAMGEAFSIAKQVQKEEQLQILAFHQQLWDGIKHIPGIRLNGSIEKRIAGNLNITFPGVDSQTLLTRWHDLAVSTTSACLSAQGQPSYVLRAIGLSNELAYSTIRLSIGRFTTEQDIQRTIRIICQSVLQEIHHERRQSASL